MCRCRVSNTMSHWASVILESHEPLGLWTVRTRRYAPMTVFIYLTDAAWQKNRERKRRQVRGLDVHRNSVLVCFEAHNIHHSGIVSGEQMLRSDRNVASPVVRLQDDQQKGENDYDPYDDDSDHRPRTWETERERGEDRGGQWVICLFHIPPAPQRAAFLFHPVMVQQRHHSLTANANTI